MKLNSATREITLEIGERIGSALQKGDIIALQGSLAAGKTTLTKGIAKGLNIDENVTSPTFTLISEYMGRLPLYHMDAYRLDDVQSFLDLGVEELLYGEGVCVIEWSEKIMEALPETAIIIVMEALLDGTHTITITNWPYGDMTK